MALMNPSGSQDLTTTESLGGGALLLGGVATIDVSLPGAAVGNAVLVAPNTFPGAGFVWFGYVSAPDVVTVVIMCIVAGTPNASTYNVWVIR